jgi:prepilin-type N-terminal cleavage/methylation domain-containing protein
MLSVTGRRGFTLAETMVTIVIMLVVAGAVYNLLFTTQRLTQAQARQVGLQSTLRSGSLIILNELRELSTLPGGGPAQNDVLRIAAASVTYRAMRGMGFICQAPTATSIRLARSGFSGHRDPQAGRDTAYVFVGASTGTDTGESWLPVAVTGVSTTGMCPGALGSGISLAIPSTERVASLEIGTPVRISELMELKLYQSEGKSWLGARSVSAGEAIQPVVGPLADGDGLVLDYFDGSGTSTTDPTSVKSVKITLRGVAESVGKTGGERLEQELVTQLTLRNAVRE